VTNQKIGGLISTWDVNRSNAQAGSIRRSLPSLPVTQVPRSNTQTSSVSTLTKTVIVTSSAKIDDGLDQSTGGILDEDEINGPERDAAISSPIKGKKRVNNAVSSHYPSLPMLQNFAKS
jgi:hypothetical protein